MIGSRKIAIAICDDDINFQIEIRCLVSSIMDEMGYSNCAIDVYSHGQEFIEKHYSMMNYDILLLDIDMPGVSGLEIAKQVRIHNSKTAIIFITSYLEYAPQGYQVNALRYVLKSHLREGMLEALSAACDRVNSMNTTLEFDCVSGTEKIDIQDLLYVESNKHVVRFHIERNHEVRQYNMYAKLDDIEASLSPYAFLRIHKSYLVNFRHIVKVRGYLATLDNGEELRIPREKFQGVKENYYELKGQLR